MDDHGWDDDLVEPHAGNDSSGPSKDHISSHRLAPVSVSEHDQRTEGDCDQYDGIGSNKHHHQEGSHEEDLSHIDEARYDSHGQFGAGNNDGQGRDDTRLLRQPIVTVRYDEESQARSYYGVLDVSDVNATRADDRPMRRWGAPRPVHQEPPISPIAPSQSPRQQGYEPIPRDTSPHIQDQIEALHKALHERVTIRSDGPKDSEKPLHEHHSSGYGKEGDEDPSPWSDDNVPPLDQAKSQRCITEIVRDSSLNNARHSASVADKDDSSAAGDEMEEIKFAVSTADKTSMNDSCPAKKTISIGETSIQPRESASLSSRAPPTISKASAATMLPITHPAKNVAIADGPTYQSDRHELPHIHQPQIICALPPSSTSGCGSQQPAVPTQAFPLGPQQRPVLYLVPTGFQLVQWPAPNGSTDILGNSEASVGSDYITVALGHQSQLAQGYTTSFVSPSSAGAVVRPDPVVPGEKRR